MRYAFGLVSLLVVTFIVIYLWTKNTAEVIDKAKPLQNQAMRMAGKDEDGVPAKDSIVLEQYPPDGKPQGLRVVSIIPNGPFEKAYGLKRNDLIVEAEMDLRDVDAPLARDMVLSAYTKSRPLIVKRGGEKLSLPLPAGSGTQPEQPIQPQTNTPSATTPPPTSAEPRDTRTPLQRQMDDLRKPR